MDLSQLPWKDIITVAAASVGAVLGIINLLNTLNQKKVRLVVRPSQAFFSNHDRKMIAIEVINFCAYPITIQEVGFTSDGKLADRSGRVAITKPIMFDEKPLPRRLEPREAVTVYCELGDIAAHAAAGRKIGKAYARTACEEYSYGDSPALRQMVKQMTL